MPSLFTITFLTIINGKFTIICYYLPLTTPPGVGPRVLLRGRQQGDHQEGPQCCQHPEDVRQEVLLARHHQGTGNGDRKIRPRKKKLKRSKLT